MMGGKYTSRRVRWQRTAPTPLAPWTEPIECLGASIPSCSTHALPAPFCTLPHGVSPLVTGPCADYQVRAAFSLPATAHPYWHNVLFFPDDAKASRIKFKQHVCDADE